MVIFAECFNIILTGDKGASRQAARQVRKLVYSSGGDGREKFEAIATIVENAPKEYAKIQEAWRQENFVMAISVMYFLHDKEKTKPDFLFPWFLVLLKHKSGNVRYAAVRMFQNELGPLTVHIRCPEYPEFQHRAEKSNPILFELYNNLMALTEDLQEPRFKKYKYIDNLPTGPYKSVQMVLGTMDKHCGEDYFNRLFSFN